MKTNELKQNQVTGMHEISPSILSANYSQIFQIIEDLQGKANRIHIDVMDNVFVPNDTFDRFNPEFVSKLSEFKIIKNVHLMVQDHLKWCEAFAKAGSDEIAFHFETGKTAEGIKLLKDHGVKAGLAIKPATPPEAIENFLEDLDFVVVMSVEPGFAGQSFTPSALPKLRWLDHNFEEPFGGKVWIDGGVRKENARECVEAGADVLVAASAIFNSNGDFLANLKELEKSLNPE